jgi:hypothetical protein
MALHHTGRLLDLGQDDPSDDQQQEQGVAAVAGKGIESF